MGGLQAEQQEDPNLAARQMEENKAEKVEKLQRVKALGLHLTHNKRFAQTQHKCCTCDRALNPSTELQPFLSKQVCNLSPSGPTHFKPHSLSRPNPLKPYPPKSHPLKPHSLKAPPPSSPTPQAPPLNPHPSSPNPSSLTPQAPYPQAAPPSLPHLSLSLPCCASQVHHTA